MKIRIAAAVVIFATACGLGWLWLTARSTPDSLELSDVVDSEAPLPRATPDKPMAQPNEDPSLDGQPPRRDVLREAGHDHFGVEDPTGDLELYERAPMSAVPHHVIRGWGARGAGKVPGFVGAIVIVDPALSDEALSQLARDVIAYHGEVVALSVRILDSAHAGLYDRHSDGGALAAAHLVGLINRNASLGIERIKIRGRILESSDSRVR